MTQIGQSAQGANPTDLRQFSGEGRFAGFGDYTITPFLVRIWQLAVRWRWLIGAIIATCVAISVVALMLASSLYSARSQIEISREQKNVTNVQSLEAEANYYSDEFYDTQYQLLKAGSLAERVARDLKLADQPDFFAAHGAEPGDSTAPLTAAERKSRESWAAGLLMGNIRVDPIRNSSLVNIGYTSRSPQWSARIANAWPQAFIAATMDRGLSSTADARSFLEGRLNDLRGRLARSERDLITFAGARNIVTLGAVRGEGGKTQEPQTLVATNLAALNGALMTARTDRIAAESKARSAAGGNSAEVLQNGTITALRIRRSEIAADYARLLVQFEPGYPAARALKAQIDTLDTAIGREMGTVQGSRRATYQEAFNRERELAAQVESLKAQFDQQQRDTIQYNVYQREVDTNRQLYDALLQRYKEIGVAGSVGATNIAIVDTAKMPGGPSSPNLANYLMLALLAGLVLSAVAIFALEQIDNGVRSPEEIEQLFKLALLGNVPRSDNDPLAELADPKSEISEAFQSARAVLSFATSRGLPTTLLVTSARAGEGKSTSSYALGMAIARTGKRVLIVDGDMRSPSVHKIVGCSNANGFSNLLAGDEVRPQSFVDSDVSGLSVLPAGPRPPSSAEILTVERLHQVFQSLLQRYEYIIVDGPPIQGMADAPLLAAAVEGTVVVIEAEKTPVRAIRLALDRLRQVNAHVIGAIVTKIDYRSHRLGYGYSYGDSYGYGYGKAQDAREQAA